MWSASPNYWSGGRPLAEYSAMPMSDLVLATVACTIYSQLHKCFPGEQYDHDILKITISYRCVKILAAM